MSLRRLFCSKIIPQQFFRDFRGPPDVLLVCGTEGGNILGQCGIADGNVFVMDVAARFSIYSRQIAITLVLVIQDFMETH